MVRCRQCRYWTVDPWPEADPPGFGTCQMEGTTEPNGFGCASAYAGAHEGVITGPEFGCVLGEAKDAQAAG